MAKKVYDEDGLDMRGTDWSGDESATGGLPVSGRLVENYIKGIDDKATPTEEIALGETKPPTSGAVFDAMVNTVTDLDVKDSEDGTQYVMTVTQKNNEGGETEKEIRFSKYTDDDKVVVNVDLTDSGGASLPSAQYLALGSSLTVHYTVNVGTVGGSEVSGYSDLKARVIVKRGSTVLSEFQNAEFTGVAAGQSYTFNATPHLTDASTYSIQVEAQATYQGQTLVKTATARVTMVAMNMQTTYSVANGTAEGGYHNDVNIPFTVKGTTGEKNIYYRLNGGTPYTEGLSGGSGTQSKNITVALSEMKEGLNVVEAYALHENSGVMSQVHYITLLKAGSSVRGYAGLMFSHKAAGFQADWKNPVLNAEQFTAWSFDYTGYDSEGNYATVRIVSGGTAVKEDRLPRGGKGSYGKTNVSTEALNYSIECGTAQIRLTVETGGHGDIKATLSPDAVCTFDAYGRSNTENDPASWTSGGKWMDFEGVLWNVNDSGAGSGWYKDRLLLSNGAGMTLTGKGGYRPFNEADKPTGYSIRDVGMTVEIEYSTDNVTDTDAELITCLGELSNGNRYGLVVTAEEAKFLTGVVTEAVDAGVTIRYEDSVGTKFEPGKSIMITYVFYPTVETNEQRGLIGFFVNGEESAASRWLNKVNFDITEQLHFSSNGADLAIKSIRIYDKALTDDEVLDNYIVSRNHLEDTESEKGVRTLDEENRVLNEGDAVGMAELQGFMAKRGNSILVLIGSGSVGSEVPSDSDTLNVMDALAQLNDKKANKLVREIRFYNGTDRSMDFILRNAYARIQGTSSVNYSRKNLRFYFQKTAPDEKVSLSYGEIDSEGNQSNPTVTEGKKNLFKLRKNSVGAKLACPKCDFSDSSMTTNTGGAKFIADGLREMGLLTPAQRYAQDHGMTEDIRAAIDGTPCDLFVAKSANEDFIYYGQYNMNNEKSDSYPVFGQDDTIGGETWGEGDTLDYLEADGDGQKQYLPICYETLNNSNPCCLFQWLPSTEEGHEDFMDNNFDGGLEFNHPKDTFWSDGGGDAAEEPNLKDHLGTGDVYDRMYKATDRMMGFVYRCVKETEAGKNLTYNTEKHLFDGVDYEDDGGRFPKAKWESATFKNEAQKYFNVPYLIAYYLYVDFQLGVDQLAKNVLWRTWDGVVWMPTYYDGDCQLGSDNTSFLTGKYDDRRETKRNGAYVMQGHNSWLWNLVLANFSEMMEQIMVSGYGGGTSFLSAFSVQKALDHFDTEQMGRWCSRLYNKSGIFKYVYPFLNPMKVGEDGAEQTYPQIYGLKGSLKAHRGYFIQRRYDLKQVEYGYVSTNGAQFYQSAAALDAGYILKELQYELTIPYRVQISTSNGVQADSGLVGAGELQSLKLKGPFGENDPLKIIGAARIKRLVWHEDAFAKGFNFGLFTSLVELDMSVASPSGYRNGSFMTATESMLLLEKLDMRNNLLARNMGDGYTATLNLEKQARLQEIDMRGTGLTKLILATGAPLVKLYLPGTLEELFLENLPKLTESGLQMEGINNFRGYRFAGCPGIDGMGLLERLHAAKMAGTGKLERFRMEIDMEDDGTLLEKYYGYKTYTSAGANDNEHSGFVGTLRLTRYPSDADLQRYREKYAELDIVLPEFTAIEFDDTVLDSANVSNLDNATGYKYDNKFTASGHVSKILAQRHRCLCKKTGEGRMTVCQLDDGNSGKYADGGSAVLTGEEGDVMMYEPHYWYKGVNDVINKKKYSLFCSTVEKPSPTDCVKIGLDGVTVRKNYAVRAVDDYPTLEEAEERKDGYSRCTVGIKGYSQVRYPSMPSALYGAVMLDADGLIVKRIKATSDSGLVAGMYCFTDIPDNAVTLAFTIAQSAVFDYVLLTHSDKVEAIEPDWVEHEECLTGVYEALLRDDFLYSISGVQSSGNITCPDFKRYARNRGKGFQLIDYEMGKDVCNLFYAKYGNRDSQGTCGPGTSLYNRSTGASNATGMQDTKPTAKDGDTPPAIVDGYYQGNAYVLKDSDDEQRTAIGSPVCMGYENWFGNKAEWMEVDFNKDKLDYIWRSPMPDGTERLIQGPKGGGDYYASSVIHGRYMDTMAAYSGGSQTKGYCDLCYQSPSTARVVCRSGSCASAGGGVACAVSGGDSAGVSASIGSRLAFRGEILQAVSSADFKAIKAEN